MLIFSVSKQSKSNPSGSPRDFIMYEVEIQNKDLLVIPYVKNNKGFHTSKVDNKGLLLLKENGCLDLGSELENVYAWGPAYKEGIESQFYYIYGTVYKEDNNNYKFGVFAYSNMKIHNKVDFPEHDLVDRITNKKDTVFHKITRRGVLPNVKRTEISIGQYSFIKTNAK